LQIFQKQAGCLQDVIKEEEETTATERQRQGAGIAPVPAQGGAKAETMG
jgi:hypothetical protein